MNNRYQHTICLDFDGTCVTHAYPEIGKDIGAVPIIKKLVNAGHRIILYTMRSDINHTLVDAIQWFRQNDIPLFAVNNNPEQSSWTRSPKIYGTAYIDDAAIGTPLTHDILLSRRPFVDWKEMDKLLLNRGFYDV